MKYCNKIRVHVPVYGNRNTHSIVIDSLNIEMILFEYVNRALKFRDLCNKRLFG